MKPPRLGEFGHLWAAKNLLESSLKLAPSMEVDGLGGEENDVHERPKVGPL